MSNSPPTRKGPRKMAFDGPRVVPGAKGTTAPLRRLKDLLGRPFGLERRGGQLHVVLADRLRPPPADQPLSLSQLRAELRASLLAQSHERATEVMRHLVLVHDELGCKGWAGVEALPGEVTGRALVQAEMLASQEPSPALAVIVERLRLLQVAADLRKDRESCLQDLENSVPVEVSESTHEEFEMERSWVGTVPGGLVPLERGQ